MMNTEKFTDRDWEELASSLSEEKGSQSELLAQFLSEDSHDTEKQWKEIRNMSIEKEIDVDKAWDKVYSRFNETGAVAGETSSGIIFIKNNLIKIAAAALILLGLGVTALYLGKTNFPGKKIIVATDIKSEKP